MQGHRVCVVNLGCRVNRVESDRITAELAGMGYELVDEGAADVVVINTCAVTGEAEAKTRKAVRHALGLPLAPTVVATGCVVNLSADELTSISSRVLAEPDKSRVAERVLAVLGLPVDGEDDGPHGLPELLGRSRLGVKIQDGCNHRCTYCIVWKARGPERSVDLEDVIAQVSEAERAGIPEVVLTGVNLGAYRWTSSDGSAIEVDGLLSAVLARTSIHQVRISSIEPMDVSPALIERMASSPDRVAPFLHLPLQSGCTETLRRMGRPYSADGFLELVSQIRTVLPTVSLSCDVIVGFPGETEEEFEKSLTLCEQVGFSRMHVFRYSARPGTPAATAPNKVPPQVMAERSARMRALASKMAIRDASSRVGTIESCVVERPGLGTLGSFHKARIDPSIPEGRIVRVRLESIDMHGGLVGKVVEAGENA